MGLDEALTEEQKEYLAGFTAGAGLSNSALSANSQHQVDANSLSDGTKASVESPPADRQLFEAQGRFLSAGKRLTAEEHAKRDRHPLDRWGEMRARSQAGEFPKGVDVFLAKSFGMFYVAPAQNSYMCRLRLPGGTISSHQFRGVADISDQLAGGYAHVTTRANLQLREIPATAPVDVLNRLVDLGIVTRGSGADNIRNVTASPTAGFDAQEWIDTLPLAREMHHYILNHRAMHHLPRKFNIAFDGGGTISSLADTNDIGFGVVRVTADRATSEAPEGIYFRFQLGGITGHRQFASDVGWLLKPEQCIDTAAATVRVFVKYGDRTNRKKARLKYLIDDWGGDKFLEHIKHELPFEPLKWPIEQCQLPPPPVEAGHLGFHPQAAPGKYFVGVVVPVGYLSTQQMRDLADIADRFGCGQIRLTCWQNLLIPGIDEADIDPVQQALLETRLAWKSHSVRAGLVACTGNAGCKFSASDTKRHALQIAEHVEQHVALDQPVNVHLTGCHHSCAQHYIGDIGLIGAKVEVPLYDISMTNSVASASDEPVEDDETEEVEGYHIFVGGGYGGKQALGREIFRDVAADDVPATVTRMLRTYLDRREGGESFVDFARRHEIDQLKAFFQEAVVA